MTCCTVCRNNAGGATIACGLARMPNRGTKQIEKYSLKYIPNVLRLEKTFEGTRSDAAGM
jgi:hypothetical protein